MFHVSRGEMARLRGEPGVRLDASLASLRRRSRCAGSPSRQHPVNTVFPSIFLIFLLHLLRPFTPRLGTPALQNIKLHAPHHHPHRKHGPHSPPKHHHMRGPRRGEQPMPMLDTDERLQHRGRQCRPGRRAQFGKRVVLRVDKLVILLPV